MRVYSGAFPIQYCLEPLRVLVLEVCGNKNHDIQQSEQEQGGEIRGHLLPLNSTLVNLSMNFWFWSWAF